MIISRVGPDLVFLAGCRMFFKENAGCRISGRISGKCRMPDIRPDFCRIFGQKKASLLRKAIVLYKESALYDKVYKSFFELVRPFMIMLLSENL